MSVSSIPARSEVNIIIKFRVDSRSKTMRFTPNEVELQSKAMAFVVTKTPCFLESLKEFERYFFYLLDESLKRTKMHDEVLELTINNSRYQVDRYGELGLWLAQIENSFFQLKVREQQACL
jgi:hypothetical protein